MIAASLISFYVLKFPMESNFQFLIYAIFMGGTVCSLLMYHKMATDKKSFNNQRFLPFAKLFKSDCIRFFFFNIINFRNS